MSMAKAPNIDWGRLTEEQIDQIMQIVGTATADTTTTTPVTPTYPPRLPEFVKPGVNKNNVTDVGTGRPYSYQDLYGRPQAAPGVDKPGVGGTLLNKINVTDVGTGKPYTYEELYGNPTGSASGAVNTYQAAPGVVKPGISKQYPNGAKPVTDVGTGVGYSESLLYPAVVKPGITKVETPMWYDGLTKSTNVTDVGTGKPYTHNELYGTPTATAPHNQAPETPGWMNSDWKNNTTTNNNSVAGGSPIIKPGVANGNTTDVGKPVIPTPPHIQEPEAPGWMKPEWKENVPNDNIYYQMILDAVSEKGLTDNEVRILAAQYGLPSNVISQLASDAERIRNTHSYATMLPEVVKPGIGGALLNNNNVTDVGTGKPYTDAGLPEMVKPGIAEKVEAPKWYEEFTKGTNVTDVGTGRPYDKLDYSGGYYQNIANTENPENATTEESNFWKDYILPGIASALAPVLAPVAGLGWVGSQVVNAINSKENIENNKENTAPGAATVGKNEGTTPSTNGGTTPSTNGGTTPSTNGGTTPSTNVGTNPSTNSGTATGDIDTSYGTNLPYDTKESFKTKIEDGEYEWRFIDDLVTDATAAGLSTDETKELIRELGHKSGWGDEDINLKISELFPENTSGGGASAYDEIAASIESGAVAKDQTAITEAGKAANLSNDQIQDLINRYVASTVVGGTSSDDESVPNGVVNTEFDKVKEFTDAINSGFVKSNKIWQEGRSYGLTDQEIQGIINSLGINTESGTPSTPSGGSGTGASDIYEEQRLEAERVAEAAKQKAIVDANTSYQQALASYGATAEALSRMGLTGGGYSDYLSGKAYSQMRGDIQSATAQAEIAKRQAALEANKAREENNAVKEAEKLAAEQRAREAFTALLDDVKSGKYTPEEAAQLAIDMNLSKAQSMIVVNAANSYTADTGATDNTLSAYVALLSDVKAGKYTAEEASQIADDLKLSAGQKDSVIKAANAYANNEAGVNADNLTEEERTANRAYAQTYYGLQDEIDASPVTHTYTDEKIDRFVDLDMLTKEDAENLKKYIVKARDSYISELIESGAIADAQQTADTLYRQKKIDKTTYEKYYFDSWQKYIAYRSGDEALGAITKDNVDDVINELLKDKNAGKISDANLTALKKYAYSKFATAKAIEESQKSKIVKRSLADFLGWKLSPMLNRISTGNEDITPKAETFVLYDGQFYAYLIENGKGTWWCLDNSNRNTIDLIAAVDKYGSTNDQTPTFIKQDERKHPRNED